MNKILSTVAVATGLTGAAFLGGVAVSSIASAQDEAPPSTEQPAPPADVPEDAPEGAPEGCRGPHERPGLEAAAEALGMSLDELREALRDGQTLAEVAEARGVDVDVVIEAMVSVAEEHLAEKVAAGELTQEEADERLAEIRERVTERVNSDEPPRRARPGHPRGPDGPGGRGFGEGERSEPAEPAEPTPEAEGSSFTF